MFPFAAAIERALAILFRLGRELLGNLLLRIGQFPHFVAHLAHFVVELAARFLAEIIAYLLELPLRTSAAGQRFRGLVLLHGLRGLLCFRPRLFHLAPFLRELRLLRRLLHLLLQLIEIGQHLLLLFAQPFELPLNLFLLLFGLGGL